MNVDPRLVADLKLAEGEKLTAYKDSLGNWTIGVGHLLPKPCTPDGWAGYTITQDVCDRFLSEDIAKAAKAASGLLEFQSCDTDCRRNALIEICFNMGVGKWFGFSRARAAMQVQNWPEVHDELLHSMWATQVHDRALRIAGYFLSGVYPS